jgi:hypothetical protein
MERRLMLIVLMLLVVVGCNSSSSTAPAPAGDDASATSTQSDPAAQVANQFLEAVVQGDTAKASQLLTPLAVEKIAASGKPFQLPGMTNYAFRVGDVRRPAPDKAFVQCMGTNRSAQGTAVEEEFCWVLSLVEQDWRIAGIIYTAGPQQTMMIYSFEDPEKGAIPVQQLRARAPGQTAGTNPTQQPTQPQAPAYPAQTPPYTAQEPAPQPSYR